MSTDQNLQETGITDVVFLTRKQHSSLHPTCTWCTYTLALSGAFKSSQRKYFSESFGSLNKCTVLYIWQTGNSRIQANNNTCTVLYLFLYLQIPRWLQLYTKPCSCKKLMDALPALPTLFWKLINQNPPIPISLPPQMDTQFYTVLIYSFHLLGYYLCLYTWWIKSGSAKTK